MPSTSKTFKPIGTAYKGSATRDGFRIVWDDDHTFPDGATRLYGEAPMLAELPESELITHLGLLSKALPANGPSRLVVEEAIAALKKREPQQPIGGSIYGIAPSLDCPSNLTVNS